ncbi:BatD family protein [Cellulophaga sp. F20128]|uniref:BatD family protein n=1 Tax=Cellulophaga sp. F20128 TaxID=2926413 RepID=UPI001FF0E22B|nr:BatD family protein [Cellulophaga sp. F20128]MCK0157483.1 BatD family protein [Cellulophaga sp. F20128]
MIVKFKKLQRIKNLSFYKRYAFLFFIFCSIFGYSQTTPKVTANIDTTAIRIGEQINYTILVEADSTAQVIFPEDQTFSPLEMVEALKIDTSKYQNRITLQRTYALTQFDSGAYTIPQQRLDINGLAFFTDSIKVNVGTVAVDTFAQKMYDIKPLIAVDKSTDLPWLKIGLILGGILLLAGLIYWFVLRKKPLTEEEKIALLPPYDRALLELKKLENSKYIIQDEYKEYYSELTTIVRLYLEEDAHVSALESTTDQLIDKLELLKDAGELKLDDETILQFKKVLQTADLVKFAKKKPETSVAEQDRALIEQIVVKTHDALPEPTEEELLENEEYLEALALKKEKKKWIIATVIFFGAILISTAAAIAYYGLATVKDTVFGHPTKELLEEEWVSSTYGYPPITLETPQVLLRQQITLPPEAKESIKELQMFAYRSGMGLFTVSVSATTFANPETEPDFNQVTDQMLKSFEANGAKNITTKQEDFTTLTGTKGLKTYGTGKFAVPNSKELVNGKYAIISFGGKGFQQQVLVSWLAEDVYAEQIVARIFNSIEVKTE